MTDSDEVAGDGGTVSDSAGDGGRIEAKYQSIREARRRRTIGYFVLIGVLGFLLVQALNATEAIGQEANYNWAFFRDSIQAYFPIDSFNGIPYIDFQVYANYIIENNLLFDKEVAGVIWPPTPSNIYEFFIVELGVFRTFGLAGTTIAMGFAGTILGFPLALLFGVLGSERVTPFPFNFIFRGTMSFIRAIPALVWVLVFIPLAGISAAAATIAIGVDTIGNLGRLFVDELEEIEDGPIEAMQTTGANRPQVIVFGMLSQVKSSFIAWTLYIFEINVRAAVGVGVIGAGGLGNVVELERGLRQYTNMMAALLCIFIVIITVELFSQRLRARLRSDEEKRSIYELITGFPDRMVNSLLR